MKLIIKRTLRSRMVLFDYTTTEDEAWLYFGVTLWAGRLVAVKPG